MVVHNSHGQLSTKVDLGLGRSRNKVIVGEPVVGEDETCLSNSYQTIQDLQHSEGMV